MEIEYIYLERESSRLKHAVPKNVGITFWRACCAIACLSMCHLRYAVLKCWAINLIRLVILSNSELSAACFQLSYQIKLACSIQ